MLIFHIDNKCVSYFNPLTPSTYFMTLCDKSK